MEVPGANGVSSGAAMAKIGAMLCGRGAVTGGEARERVMSEQTWEKMMGERVKEKDAHIGVVCARRCPLLPAHTLIHVSVALDARCSACARLRRSAWSRDVAAAGDGVLAGRHGGHERHGGVAGALFRRLLRLVRMGRFVAHLQPRAGREHRHGHHRVEARHVRGPAPRPNPRCAQTCVAGGATGAAVKFKSNSMSRGRPQAMDRDGLAFRFLQLR